MDVKKYLNDYNKRSNEFLESYFDVQMGLADEVGGEVVKEGIKNFSSYTKGGKKLRGALTVLGYQIAGGQELDKIIAASCGIELFHNFLLIHDDVIDRDEERRGKSTIHKLYEGDYGEHYGLSSAILIGDMGAFLGYNLIVKSNFSQERLARAFGYLNKYLLWTVYGQMLDVNHDYVKEISWEEMEKIRKYKTANYTIVMPLVVGATLKGVDNDKISLFEKYGVYVGIAFQLVDDILGVFGNPQVTGKSNVSDIKDGKKTFLYAKALESADEEDREFLLKWYGSDKLDSKKVEKIRAILKDSGSLDFSNKLARKKVEEGKKYIPQITKNKKYAEVLSTLADFVVERSK